MTTAEKYEALFRRIRPVDIQGVLREARRRDEEADAFVGLMMSTTCPVAA